MNPTQWLGQASFAVAAVACASAARWQPRPWRGLAVAQALCFIELMVELRLRSHDGVDSWLRGRGWYATRGSLQLLLLAVVAVVVLVVTAALVVRWRRRDPAGALAIAATAAVVAAFLVETVSLHRVDAAMYAQFGRVMAVGWFWCAGACVATAAAAWRVSRRRIARLR